MARYTVLELDNIIKDPSEATNWNWSNLDPSREESDLSWITDTRGLDDIGDCKFEIAIDNAGTKGLGNSAYWFASGEIMDIGLTQYKMRRQEL